MFLKFFILIHAFLFVGIHTLKNYGKFDIAMLAHTIQVNEKFKDFINVAYKFDNLPNGTVAFAFHGHAKKDMGVAGMKLRVFKWNEDLQQYQHTVNLLMDNLCKHQLGKLYLSVIPDVLDKKCNIVKGVYNFTLPDFSSFVHALTLGKFFYGRFSVLTDLTALGKGRLFRSNTTFVLKPAA